MEINIENLKAKMKGIKLTTRQEADALIEFNRLLDYTNELEAGRLQKAVANQFNSDATLKLELNADSGYRSTEEHRINPEKWSKIMKILYND